MQTSKSLGPCPICGGQVDHWGRPSSDDVEAIDCRNCGHHRFSGRALVNARRLASDPERQAAVGHAIWRRPPGDIITMVQLENLISTVKLPPALQRLDLLVTHLATTVEPGGVIDSTPKRLKAKLGCETPEAVQWVVSQALAMGLVTQDAPGELCLSAEGWKRFAELERTGARSKIAIMAMSFADGPTQTLFKSQGLREAVAQTGFHLEQVGEQPDAQLIDVSMQVALRTCRFVVCDLSDHNRGAYWEAGFATGMGRPVFYLCRTKVLERTGQPDGPHFDTNHYPIIPWDPDHPEPALRRLKGMIRATLPEEATMQDAPAVDVAVQRGSQSG